MSANSTLDERYFDWICDLIGANSTRDPDQSHILLAEQLFRKSFDDSTPNDFNRARDGQDIRREFLEDTRASTDVHWLELDCSMLELMVGLSRRLSFHTEWSENACFWLLITNLELDKYTDGAFSDGAARAINFVLDTVNERTYERNGRGGLFPLKDTPIDQRGVELWYQMASYLLENFEF